MGVIEIVCIVITIIIGILLTLVIMKQDSKSGSSSITGGNTFYGSNKSNTLDGILSKATVVLAILFIIFCIITTAVLV